MLIVVNTNDSTAVPYVPLPQKIIVVPLCFSVRDFGFFDIVTEP